MADIKAQPILRQIYKNNTITLQFFTTPPQTVEQNKKYTTSISSILYLQINCQTFTDVEAWKTMRYPIKQSNLYDVIIFFNTIVGWFEDDSMSDLYLMTDDNQMVFNSKYENLFALSRKSYFQDCQMRAVPAIIEVAQNKYVEGIYLYINKKTNMVRLTKDEVIDIFNILRTFNFVSETLLSLDLIRYSVLTGTSITSDEFQEMRKNSGTVVKW